MNISDFQGTIPDGRLNQPDKKSWEKDMEEENECAGCRYWLKGITDFPCAKCNRRKEDCYEPTPLPEGEPDDEKA